MNVHFIAIGGSIMHQLALALKRKGYQVSGSDDAIFDPAKTSLQKKGLLPPSLGWFPDRIHSKLDAVILGMHAKNGNPELERAKELNVPIYSFPEYIFNQSKNKTRVAIAGSHGKTTITSMVMHVLQKNQLNFDYLVGARINGFPTSVEITSDSQIIILEGDEYLSSAINPVPKIHYYQPQIALLSGIAWDHINVFPTYELYLKAFSDFLQKMENGSTLVYNSDDSEVVKIVESYGIHLKLKPYSTPKYTVKNGQVYLSLKNGEENRTIAISVFGKHNLQNLAGAQLICESLGVSLSQFANSISDFSGAGKRLELLAKSDTRIVYRDFAHAPSKALATVEAVKELYPERKLLAIFELHTYSSLNTGFLPQFKGTLNKADSAVVFVNSHTLEIKGMKQLDPDKIKQGFDHPNLIVFTEALDLESFLNSEKTKSNSLLLMSSGNLGNLQLSKVAQNYIQ